MEFAANVMANLIDIKGNGLPIDDKIYNQLSYLNGSILATGPTSATEDLCGSLFKVDACVGLKTYSGGTDESLAKKFNV